MTAPPRCPFCHQDRGMVVDGDLLRDLIAEAAPRYLVDEVAHQIADVALDGAVRAGMTVLHGPEGTPRKPVAPEETP